MEEAVGLKVTRIPPVNPDWIRRDANRGSVHFTGPRVVSSGCSQDFFFGKYAANKERKKYITSYRKVWVDANGPIPKGCVVHHIDHNHENHALSNLQCMTYQEHNLHHKRYEKQ
jgi:hypothetical protein